MSFHHKKKFATAGLFLILRQVLMQGLNIAGSIFLARFLSPSDFGLFAIFTFFLAFLMAFGDVGLAASLVREEIEPSEIDYLAVFSIQLVLVALASGVFVLLAPVLAAAYGLSAESVGAFRLLGLALFLTAFITIPMVRLERRLAFRQIAAIEVTQAFVFNVVAVVLAWSGFGVWSFSLALLCRAIVGVALANICASWRPRWLWRWPLVSPRLAFGANYQGVKFVSLVKDSVSPVIIGFLLGTTSVGYVNWAGMVAAYPVMALFVLQRLYLPAFAQMQANRVELAKVVEGVIWVTNLIAAPLAVMTLVFSEPITTIIFGEQWLVALPLLYLFWMANLFVATVTPAMSLLDSVGRSNVNFRFSMVWMLGNWVVGIPLLLLFGLLGYAVANLFVQFTNIALFRVAQEEAPFKIVRTIFPLWCCAALVGALCWVLLFVEPITNVLGLIAYGAIGLAIYVTLILFVQKSRVIAGIDLIRG